jgi:hypothetical protein
VVAKFALKIAPKVKESRGGYIRNKDKNTPFDIIEK